VLTPSDPAQSCGLALLNLEGVEPGKLSGYLFSERRIITTPIVHPEFQGIRVTRVFTPRCRRSTFSAMRSSSLQRVCLPPERCCCRILSGPSATYLLSKRLKNPWLRLRDTAWMAVSFALTARALPGGSSPKTSSIPHSPPIAGAPVQRIAKIYVECGPLMVRISLEPTTRRGGVWLDR